MHQCSRAGNLCENTVKLAPALDADIPPCFTVADLSNDERFSNAPYVAGPPYKRFYCGTPITTSSHFNVGLSGSSMIDHSRNLRQSKNGSLGW